MKNINKEWLKEFQTKMVWMIHEIDDDDIAIIKTLDPETNVLIFDDAVLSQNKISHVGNEYTKILAVSVGVADAATKQNEQGVEWEPTHNSHKKWFDFGDASSFMTWPMIKKLHEKYDVEIALHGLNHARDVDLPRMFTANLERAIEIYERELEIYPEIYVYPFNQRTVLSDLTLRAKGIIGIGQQRMDFYKLKQKFHEIEGVPITKETDRFFNCNML